MDRRVGQHGQEKSPELSATWGAKVSGGRRIFGLIGALAVLLGIGAATFIAGCADGEKSDTSTAPTTAQTQQLGAIVNRDTITVIGKAKVTSAPDEAVLTLSVENDGADAAKALDVNSQSTQKVIDRLKAEGLEDSAIETANVTVYPIRTYDPKTGKESLTGYRAQNTVTVTLKDALKVGKVLAAAVETGATNITGPEWRLSEDSAAVTEALKKAVANAKTKAEAVAEGQGIKLGDVIMMNEGGVEVPIVPVYSDLRLTAAEAAKVAEPPISPATLDITATITVTYSLSR
ncbi:MAG TPA: SIMPL domain-containing protein [Thermoleophilia bacterium]|nr:SIMPL domain-containing protein [Thermoleophilia bacterium]